MMLLLLLHLLLWLLLLLLMVLLTVLMTVVQRWQLKKLKVLLYQARQRFLKLKR